MPDLTPELVLQAYRAGLFPMADEAGEIAWFSPDPRGILDLGNVRVSRSLRKTVRRGVFDVRFDTGFEEVVRACADRREGTWISAQVFAVYARLHETGQAHSVESWRAGRLVGGLYGVAIAGAFFGESMFHRETDASKVALLALIDHLRGRGFALLDVQWPTPHLRSLGAEQISRKEYLERLAAALSLPVHF